MIETIYKHQPLTVTEIYVKLRLEQSVASQHLGILRRADIVITVRKGKNMYYQVNLPRIKSILAYSEEVLTVK